MEDSIMKRILAFVLAALLLTGCAAKTTKREPDKERETETIAVTDAKVGSSPEVPEPEEPIVQEQPEVPIAPSFDEPVAETTSQKSSGVYVGSIDSDKYHNPSCRFAKEILPENEIWFDSIEDAQNSGYSPCGGCHPK